MKDLTLVVNSGDTELLKVNFADATVLHSGHEHQRFSFPPGMLVGNFVAGGTYNIKIHRGLTDAGYVCVRP